MISRRRFSKSKIASLDRCASPLPTKGNAEELGFRPACRKSILVTGCILLSVVDCLRVGFLRFAGEEFLACLSGD